MLNKVIPHRKASSFYVVILIMSILFYGVYYYNISKPQVRKEPKKRTKVVHSMVVFTGLLSVARNEHELAAVIAHEFAHLELGHTQRPGHSIYLEYHSDITSVYYLEKAGYNKCAISRFWNRVAKQYISIQGITHPLHIVRANYMKFPGCKNVKIADKKLTIDSIEKVYNKIAKQVEVKVRANTNLTIWWFPVVNAYVTSDEVVEID